MPGMNMGGMHHGMAGMDMRDGGMEMRDGGMRDGGSPADAGMKHDMPGMKMEHEP